MGHTSHTVWRFVYTTSRLTPHSMQNLAVSTGNLFPHSWQNRDRRGPDAESLRQRCSDASEPLELSEPPAPRHAGLRRDDARDDVRFSVMLHGSSTPQLVLQHLLQLFHRSEFNNNISLLQICILSYTSC